MSGTLMERIQSAVGTGLADRHSFFQLQHFVIGKESTHQGKMWQCVREIRARRSQIESIEREIDEAKDRAELLDIQRERNGFALEAMLGAEGPQSRRDLAVRESEVLDRQIARQEEAIRDSVVQLREKLRHVAEEASFLVDTLEILRAAKPMTPLDDLESQKEYWTQKLANEVHLKLILRQSLDVELVKTVLALHDDSPIKQQICSILAQESPAKVSLDARPPE